MIFQKRNERKEETSKVAISIDHVQHIAVFPLALPLIAGPGAISATVLLAGSFAAPLDRALLIGMLAFVMFLVLMALIIAEKLDRYLGVTGRALLTRLLGVLLAALPCSSWWMESNPPFRPEQIEKRPEIPTASTNSRPQNGMSSSRSRAKPPPPPAPED